MPPNETLLKFGGVCVSCNTGWLSQLEEQAAPILKPLISGDRQVLLSDADRAIIVRWIMKTGMMFDAVEAKRLSQFFSEYERVGLMTDSIENFYPTVFLAPYFGQVNGLGASFQQLIYDAHRNSERGSDADSIKFHLTMNLGRLAVEMVCLHGNPLISSVRTVVHPGRYFGDRVVQIAPRFQLVNPQHGILWPPAGHLDDAEFALFQAHTTTEFIGCGHLEKLRTVRNKI